LAAEPSDSTFEMPVTAWIAPPSPADHELHHAQIIEDRDQRGEEDDDREGGTSFALAALPVIIFFASLISILYYLRVMQFVVRWVGGAIQP
jgi:hypothetical protein